MTRRDQEEFGRMTILIDFHLIIYHVWYRGAAVI
jgi:hypothetical protein